jgi:hypothetical protein
MDCGAEDDRALRATGLGWELEIAGGRLGAGLTSGTFSGFGISWKLLISDTGEGGTGSGSGSLST